MSKYHVDEKKTLVLVMVPPSAVYMRNTWTIIIAIRAELSSVPQVEQPNSTNPLY